MTAPLFQSSGPWPVLFLAYLAAALACGFALWKGDRPVKLAAIVILAAWTLTPLVGRRGLPGGGFALAVADSGVAVLVTWISMRWRRLWAAVLAAFSILLALTPIVFMLDRDLRWSAFAAADALLAVGQLVALTAGAGLAGRRRGDERVVRP